MAKKKKVHRSGSTVNKTSVPTVICPEVMLPESMTRNRTSVSSSQSDASRKQKQREEELRDFESMFSSVKELGSSQLTGLAKKKYKEDKLTKLGALPAKQPTMPFAQKMGILAGRKKREERLLLQAKQSGVVLATKKKGNTSRERVKTDKGLDVHTKRGVLHLKRDTTVHSFKNKR